MPKYNACRYVEVMYSEQIEAPNEQAALAVALGMTDAQWGSPDRTMGDEIVVFNETGDEVERSHE